MEEIIILPILFLGLPWLLFHYITKWKQAGSISGSDEKLLDELHDMAKRLDDRLCTIERIMTAENPDWRQHCLPEASTSIEDDLSLSRSRSRSRMTTGE